MSKVLAIIHFGDGERKPQVFDTTKEIKEWYGVAQEHNDRLEPWMRVNKIECSKEPIEMQFLRMRLSGVSLEKAFAPSLN